MKQSGKSGGAGNANAAAPARRTIANKLRFIARHRGMKVDEAWDRIVTPAVQAEFDRCVQETSAGTSKKG